MITRWKLIRSIALLLGISFLAACSQLPRNPVPVALMPAAEIPGMPNIRAGAGHISAVFEADLLQSYKDESKAMFRQADGTRVYPHLALSGGGPNGAFGAGFLNGWTETGKRPVFKVVSGVSTGALIAPFAFLGSDHDKALHDFYTTTTTRDIFHINNLLFRLFFRESLADTSPLSQLIDGHITPQLLSEIAKAHKGGRRLYMGTVDLDSQRFIVWNMGLIASKGTPEALMLFRKVMLASSSVPVAFSPVFFDVVANGKHYDEMHVDGGVAARVFYNGGVYSSKVVRARAGLADSKEDIYIIHNGQLGPQPEPTPRLVRNIALRTLDSTSKAALVGDLYRIYAFSLAEQSGFHWITIPPDVDINGAEIFDPVKMERLYQAGYAEGLRGPEWSLRPPGSIEMEVLLKEAATIQTNQMPAD
ncbi:patatin-like phospholipase family protein [Yersinia pseudotuberculosis]|uniref:Patatin-like phospholipase family protein n=1 Tax=Yersinia pseudotuberculosis TaxID=633 RepID=A0ABN5R8V9_YERPU|nr:patatin-like phospholipase family protein [Yersinia pseudotuberculosis]CQD49502.1 putative lipoprotein [Yersinia intermedia]AJJ01632.1 patatin-like phospholipase family protein [Yersinia pseudotuberculosis]AJJ67980.1 patatin-like phospholipase family protein [Yersinia pseudotuberculosis PB1/+]AYW92894.1 patatin-like phospholipase family protein [Yersinia pseudotuberculosis]AYW97057.1 patatin-like phospholipase family protein [Yersinia pseudotuberculosis]